MGLETAQRESVQRTESKAPSLKARFSASIVSRVIERPSLIAKPLANSSIFSDRSTPMILRSPGEKRRVFSSSYANFEDFPFSLTNQLLTIVTKDKKLH